MGNFDAKAHLRQIQGKDYLDVRWRIVWFREDYPQATITTDPGAIGDLIYVRARIVVDGVEIASGLATVREATDREKTWAGRILEKAETTAIGRALALAGYGTQFTEEVEDDNHLADAPVERKPASTNGHKADTERPANGNGKAWYLKADNVDLIVTKIADEFNLDMKPVEVISDFLGDKALEDFPTGREAFEHMRSNAVAWCLRAFVAPPSAPENANSDAKNDAPTPGYKAAVKRAAKPVPFPPPNTAKTLDEVPVSKTVDLSRAPE